MTNTNATLVAKINEFAPQFKKALASEKAAVTGRANARAKQAEVAFGMGGFVRTFLASDGVTLEVAAESIPLDKAYIDKIGKVGRVTKGLAAGSVDVSKPEHVEALVTIWASINTAKPVPAKSIDAIGAKPFATVEALADAVKAARPVAAPTVEASLKALAKALSDLSGLVGDVLEADQQEALEEAETLLAGIVTVATGRDEEEQAA